MSPLGENTDKGEFVGEEVGRGAYSFIHRRIIYSASSGCWALYQLPEK